MALKPSQRPAWPLVYLTSDAISTSEQLSSVGPPLRILGKLFLMFSSLALCSSHR